MSIKLIPPAPMSAKEAIPCAICHCAAERTGDFMDYLQCTNPRCNQSIFAIHQSEWPRILTDEEKERAMEESEE